jgi:hypothetical protein
MTAAIGHNSDAQGDWVKTYRSVRDNPIVGFLNEDGTPRGGAICETMAWIDLTMEAAWKDKTVNSKGRVVLIERGQLIGARDWLAKRWGWTAKKVRYFMEKLARHGMVQVAQPRPTSTGIPEKVGPAKRPAKGNAANVVTICNYNIYQAVSEIADLLDAQQMGQRGASEGPESKKGRREEEDSESSLRSDSTQPALPGCVPDEEPNDPAWRLWNKCVPWLIERSDKQPNEVAAGRSVRSLVGKWQKKMEPIALLRVIRSAGERKLTGKDLTAYIAGAVEKAVASAKRDDVGRLELVNGFRQEIEGLLKGRDLRMTLDRIGGSIPMHVVGVELETKVRSEVIRLMDIEGSWEKRQSQFGNRANQSSDERWLDRELAKARQDGLLV